MNYIDSLIVNNDMKAQQLQKIAALHSDEQDRIDAFLTECSEYEDISIQNIVNGFKGFYLEYFVNYKITLLLFMRYEFSPNLEFLESYYEIAAKLGIICKTEDVFRVLKTFSGDFARLILLKYGNAKLSSLFEANEEGEFLSELVKINLLEISLTCGFKATMDEFQRFNYSNINKKGIDIIDWISSINNYIMKIDGSGFIINTIDYDQLKEGKEIISFENVSKVLIRTFYAVFDVFRILSDNEKKFLKTICDKSFYQDDLWIIYFQAYGEKYGQGKLVKLLNCYEEKDPDLADLISAYKDSYLANEQSEATMDECEEHSILIYDEKQDVTAIDNSTYHGTAKLELGDEKTRYSELRKSKYYKQVKEFFSNTDIYAESRHDEDCKGQESKKVIYYDSELWEDIYYIAKNVKNKTELVGFMYILYESNCFNWSKMISILIDKMYDFYGNSDNASIDSAFVAKYHIKELRTIFKDKEKPEWKAIRNHIQAMFNMMFMRKENYGKIKDNYKSNGKRYASTQFSKNTTMELFAQLFGYELNTKELEKIKESQKKTNEKRKGERKYVSPHKKTIEFDDNKHSSENTQSSYD